MHYFLRDVHRREYPTRTIDTDSARNRGDTIRAKQKVTATNRPYIPDISQNFMPIAMKENARIQKP